ncbi:MAG: hypothetical protein A3E84_03200 [Gammaproteobacteria bacterium RIFCSPHIGHO2_12_FULL_42_13]|nr:MAG: hypothetical protein A3E84_03200 [Gammaproteobacteria bacterium RIFCSPHIGHO2_12_FULL_42_13]
MNPRVYTHKPIVYIIGLIAALAGLLFGIDIGVISGALSYLQTDLNLSTAQLETVTSSILIGAVLGAMGSGWINRRFGRHFAILVSAAIFVVGSIASAMVSDYATLVAVRIILGLALGVASFSAPLYLSEMAPADIRGRLISGYQLMITIGIVLAYLSDAVFTQLQITGTLSTTQAWRWMLGVVAIPAALMFVLVLFLPRSPRWTALRGLDEETLRTLKRIRHEHQVYPEFMEIKETVTRHIPVRDLLRNKSFLKVIFLGVMLQFIQQFSGMNAILYYAPIIFGQAGFNQTDGMWITVSIGVVNVVTTIFSLYLIERLGRRALMYLGAILLFISTTALAILFHLGLSDTNAMLAIASVFLFIIGFAISYGPVVWTLCSEVYPLHAREFGVTCSTAANWLGNSLIAAFSLSIMNSVGVSGFFLILAIFAVLSFIFFRFFLPETKNVSLERIEKNVWANVPLCQIGEA